ncbi:hypothetical protein M378DRAFT_167214, partial [Amanita muscaria Koide BX008]
SPNEMSLIPTFITVNTCQTVVMKALKRIIGRIFSSWNKGCDSSVVQDSGELVNRPYNQRSASYTV